MGSIYIGNNGCGTVFELTPGIDGSWSGTRALSFAPNGTRGKQQISGVVLDSAGKLY